MKIAFLLLLGFSAQAAEPLTELNDFAKKALLERQPKLSEDLETKLVTDLGLPVEQARRAVTTLEEAKYTIEFENEAGCNPWTNDLLAKDREYKARLEEQAESAAEFLKDFHFRMLGRNLSLFKVRKIRICTNGHSQLDPTLTYDRAKFELTLWIGPKQTTNIPVSPLRRNNLHPYTRDQIKQAWDESDAFGKRLFTGEVLDARKNPVRVYWKFLNPVGQVRTALRDGLRSAALLSVKTLKALNEEGGAKGLKDKMLSLLGADGSRLDGMDDAALRRLSSSWLEKLEDPKAAEEMAVAALSKSLQAAIESQNTKIKRKQWGFVNVENFHKIDVTLNTGDIQTYREVVQVPDNLDIDVTQVGFVNVSTTDRVEVSVVLSAMVPARTFEIATLRSLLSAPKSSP